jgi:ABC-type Zn uptake system ZnuABC Zn-binding protein ZnuA
MAFLPLKTSLISAAATALSCIILLAGCSSREALPPGAEGKIVVIATILPLADWARQVGGDRVYVQTLLPAGASPHTFDPTPRDMRLISRAKLLLKVGLHMDDWGASLATSAGKDGPRVISLGETLQKQGKLPDVGHFDATAEQIGGGEADHSHHDHDGHDHGSVNPHFWLDPHMAIASVEIIRDTLTEADPAGKATYDANASSYIQQLRALDKELAAGLAPYAGRAFVSFHNAWPYLAERYHLKIAAVIEEYAGKAPGEKYLRGVTDRLKTLGIKTIFSEPQLNPRVAEVLATEVGATVSVLDPYGTAGVESRDTYIETMQFNLKQLQAAFAAEAAP